jgi:hypothetical protein
MLTDEMRDAELDRLDNLEDAQMFKRHLRPTRYTEVEEYSMQMALKHLMVGSHSGRIGSV